MVHLEISTQVARKLQELSEQTSIPVDEILLKLLDEYGTALLRADRAGVDADQTWTAEELADVFKPQKPLTGKEMVEQGFIGGWEDMGIQDSVEWLAQQKAKRRAKNQW